MKKYERNYDLETENDYNKYIDKIFDSNAYGKFKVLGAHSKDTFNKKYYICEFLDTKYQILAVGKSIIDGTIKDKYYPVIYNKGYVGEVKSSLYPQEYSLWHSILMRLYSLEYLNKRPKYKNVKICGRWHCFEYFLKDIKNIIGYEEYIKYNNKYKFNLDKDLFSIENKIYSLNTCCFIPLQINIFMTNEHIDNTSGYTGVSWDKLMQQWLVQMRKFGNNCRRLGYANSPEEGHKIYIQERKKYLLELLEKYNWLDDEIKDRLKEKYEI